MSMDRVLGGLAGLATGNVLGLCVEGRRRESVRTLLGAQGPLLRLPREERHRAWDDDLAMALVLAGHLASKPGAGPDPAALMNGYLAWFRSNGRGIGGLTREVLLKAASGEPQAAERVWRARCDRGQRPLGNGAAMRSAPVGLALAGTPGAIAAWADQDAALTHWDPACRQSAAAVALLAAAGVRGEADPLGFARTHLGALAPEVDLALRPQSLTALAERRLDDWDMGSTLVALQAAVSLLASGLPYAEALPWLLRQGGDTDTNGAVAGALLGARDGFQAIPEPWWACVPGQDAIRRAALALAGVAA